MTPLHRTHRPRNLAAGLLLALAVAAPVAEAAAQATPSRTSSSGRLRVPSPALARGRFAVVVDLDANQLYFAEGRRVIWSAPVGTGTGLRLETDRDAWDFSTPNGVFQVQYKEQEPVWIAPDWYFLENNLPVPPSRDDPRRRFPGGLGAAAVYLGQGLAIHGTDKPELLGQRVSHGCIRLSNADALRLYHNVQLGTEVVIVGGPERPATPPPVAPAARTGSRRGAAARPASRPPQRDPFVVAMEALATPELLDRLDDELFVAAAEAGDPRWPRVASVLMERGLRGDDDEALEGLLARAAQVGDGMIRREYATFLADAYTRGTLRTLDALARLERRARIAAARAIVTATVGLFPGALDAPSVPWPTRRVPRDVLRRTALRGWDAIADVETELRGDRRGAQPAIE